MTVLLHEPDARVHHATWADLLTAEPNTVADLLCVDAPYSDRTHKGHDDGSATANRVANWARGKLAKGVTHRAGGSSIGGKVSAVAARGGAERRTLNYAAWTTADVNAFVDGWLPRTRRWLVSLTDHVLAPAWEAALQRHGWYVFSPIACVEPGSRVRMTGDGPAQWSTLAVVARPSTAAAAKWRSLPGAYVVPPGHGDTRTGRRLDDLRVVGAKPEWLMAALVRDYSNPGDVVIDPCCGGGRTLVAARRAGRIAVGGDALLEHAQKSADALRGVRPQVSLFDAVATTTEQGALFGETA